MFLNTDNPKLIGLINSLYYTNQSLLTIMIPVVRAHHMLTKYSLCMCIDNPMLEYTRNKAQCTNFILNQIIKGETNESSK